MLILRGSRMTIDRLILVIRPRHVIIVGYDNHLNVSVAAYASSEEAKTYVRIICSANHGQSRRARRLDAHNHVQQRWACLREPLNRWTDLVVFCDLLARTVEAPGDDFVGTCLGHLYSWSCRCRLIVKEVLSIDGHSCGSQQ